MALSEQEQRLLDEMERSLYQNDADVVSTTPRDGVKVSPRSIAVGILALAIGIGIVIVGIALQQPLIGLLGFAALVGGVYWALSGKAGGSAPSETQAKQAPHDGNGRSNSAKRNDGDSFMNKMEDRWNRRQDGTL